MMLRVFKRQDIDDVLWNETIQQAHNGVIYALTYFLDQAVYPWEAVIHYDQHSDNPYRVVMPLIIGKKYGLKYLAYEPYLTELGIFSERELNQDSVNIFVKIAEKQAVKVNRYPFETSISKRITASIKREKLKETRLYYFNLHVSYSTLRSAYNRNRRRILAKTDTSALEISETGDIESHVALFSKYTYPKIDGMEPAQLDQLKAIYNVLNQHGLVKIYDVRSNGEILSSGMFLIFKNKLTYYTCTNTTLGTKLNSQSVLFDFVLKQHAKTDFMLEAYSGTHAGVSYFYESFGAIKKNVLVWNDQKLKLWNALKKK